MAEAIEPQTAPTRQQIDELAHGIAYDAACTLIESSCMMGAFSPRVWLDTGRVDHDALDKVLDSVTYLEWRGLIERHPEHPAWVSLRDESEATA